MKKYILILLILILIYPLNTLVLSNQGHIYLMRTLQANEVFAVRWIHSVELEPWEEHFIIRDGQITLYKTRFKAFGAGVPDSAGKKTYMEEDYIVFDEINQVMKNLIYGISKQAEHILFIDDKAYLLYEFVPEDLGLSFEYKKTTLFKYFYYRFKTDYKAFTRRVEQIQ